MNETNRSIGDLLREWRQRRRLSQLGLALEAEVSQRHLSFVESGWAAPSREMVLRLAERLAILLRERNRLLVAAGYAPVYSERRLDDPALDTARRVIELILRGHEPYPALAVDRHWTLVMANRPLLQLLAGVDGSLLQPPVNVLRVSLHPAGLAARIANFREWRAHILERLAKQVDASADPVLVDLMSELGSYPSPPGAAVHRHRGKSEFAGIAVPLRLTTAEGGVLSFLSTTTVFGTPIDISLSELAIESFFPADAATAAAMQALGDALPD